MNDNVLEFHNIFKTFGVGRTRIDALKDVNLIIESKSLNLILGSSGSGKSTLLNLASLIDTPTNGDLLLKDINTNKLSDSEKSRIRRDEIGIIYQRDNLFPYLNILENVMVPRVGDDKIKAVKLLKIVGLEDVSKFPNEISIMDQQRVAFSRALINNPSLLLADEPTGELNSEDAKELLNLIRDVGGKCGVLIASNNSDLSEYCDKIFYLKDGILTGK
ncbi:MAG: ABC transporter ATP-binding protein [Methanobacterium sp.]